MLGETEVDDLDVALVIHQKVLCDGSDVSDVSDVSDGSDGSDGSGSTARSKTILPLPAQTVLSI